MCCSNFNLRLCASKTGLFTFTHENNGMKPLRIQKRCNTFRLYYIYRVTNTFKIVTSLQITWEWLRRERYLQILTLFRREKISAVVYSKCIGLCSLARIKFIPLSHQQVKQYRKSTRCNNNNLLISKISSTYFGKSFPHLQERKTEIYSTRTLYHMLQISVLRS